MPWASDDLAQVMIQPDREHAGYAQGILRSWNADTFENVVEVRGGRLTNLPVASGVEALTYKPGDVLMLTRWKPRSGRGIAQYWIGSGGRVIFPGAGRAEQAIAFMQTGLAKSISAQVFAARVHVGVATGQTVTDDADFGDGSAAGPTVADVEVTDAGLAIVDLGALVDAGPREDAGSIGASMSLEVSGATSFTPSALRSMSISQSVFVTGATGWSHRTGGRFTASVPLDLNPGMHTFTAKYRTNVEGQEVRFMQRVLKVTAF